jgi:hypothetical protein
VFSEAIRSKSRPVTLQGQTSSSSQVFRTDTPSSASSFTMAVSQQVSSESFLQSIGTKNSKSLNDFHFDDK